jgi:hypothetical protein
MRDLLIITPTRKRLKNAQRLVDAVAGTVTMQTDLVLAVDADDEQSYAGKLRLAPNVKVVMGPRKTCIEWTNKLAAEMGKDYRALASFGDDHAPLTHGWDAHLLAAIDEMGGTGIAYGNDTAQGQNLPTAPVVSTEIVTALGWFMYPGFGHFFADNVWKDIAMEASCLAYLPQVIIKHNHFAFGTAAPDATYAEAAPAWAADEPAYWSWRSSPDGLAADVKKVRALCQRGAS